MSESNGSPKLKFDSLELRKEIVEIGNDTYIVTEASEGAISAYENHLIQCSRFETQTADLRIGGMTFQAGIPEADTYLLSRCLFKRSENGDKIQVGDKFLPGHPVDFNTIATWPQRITKSLVDLVKIISDMKKSPEESKESVGNALSDTRIGSP